jgi:hypothetical protein
MGKYMRVNEYVRQKMAQTYIPITIVSFNENTVTRSNIKGPSFLEAMEHPSIIMKKQEISDYYHAVYALKCTPTEEFSREDVYNMCNFNAVTGEYVNYFNSLPSDQHCKGNRFTRSEFSKMIVVFGYLERSLDKVSSLHIDSRRFNGPVFPLFNYNELIQQPDQTRKRRRSPDNTKSLTKKRKIDTVVDVNRSTAIKKSKASRSRKSIKTGTQKASTVKKSKTSRSNKTATVKTTRPFNRMSTIREESVNQPRRVNSRRSL